MKKNFRIVREVWLGLGLSLFSLFFLRQCDGLNQRTAQYPKIMLTILLLLSAALLLQGLYYSFQPEQYQRRYGKSNKSIQWNVVTQPLFVFGASIVYLCLFYFTNFFLATAIFVPLLMWIFGERRVMPILLTTIGLELFVYLVFVQLLHVYFPV